ncbi:hypothetical protein [Methylomagnum ishizawai]|uniref:hypothetical protein n=1 Tax=Methylomagnum ishizawai TaxID=1760988 RepID=UPI001C330A8B|nr:hypothetical protein [Methylomagnum ishizawai]BBL74717.1 hypothetical protein MishRS11D_18150 [Methylomagnum ishizawai]
MAKKKSVAITRKPNAIREIPADEPTATRHQNGPAVFDLALDPPTGPVHVQPVGPEAAKPAAKGAAGTACPLGKLVYGTVFGISYGVVFTAILLGKLIPGSGLIRRSMGDGAVSAERFFEAGPAREEGFGPGRLRA